MVCSPILTIEGSPNDYDLGKLEVPEAETSFSEKDAIGIHSHNDDPTVITVKCDNWEIKRLLIDQGITTNILY